MSLIQLGTCAILMFVRQISQAWWHLCKCHDLGLL